MTDSYERLEYLGDAVLDYLISSIIISTESLDNLDPGRITDIRYPGRSLNLEAAPKSASA